MPVNASTPSADVVSRLTLKSAKPAVRDGPVAELLEQFRQDQPQFSALLRRLQDSRRVLSRDRGQVLIDPECHIGPFQLARAGREVRRQIGDLVLYDVGDEKHFDLRQSSAHALGIGHASRQAATEHEERSKVARLDLVDQRDGRHLPELPWQLRTCGDHEGMPRGTAARSKTRYAVRLTVPRRGGWRAWGADFERALADVADPAIASAEIASELRRGADYVRVSVVLTVVTTDVCSSQRIASSHQAGSGATLPA